MMTYADIIKEIKRELAMRKQVYPGFIDRGKLTRDQANEQFLRLQAGLKIVEAAQDLAAMMPEVQQLGLELEHDMNEEHSHLSNYEGGA